MEYVFKLFTALSQHGFLPSFLLCRTRDNFLIYCILHCLNGPKFHQFDSVRRVFEDDTSKSSGEPAHW